MPDSTITRARQPSARRRSLVYWTGDKGGPVLDAVDAEVTSAVALSLANAARNKALIARAKGDGLGVMLELEAWRGQLSPKHRMRKGWRPPGLEPNDIVDPDAPFDAGWCRAVAEQSTDAMVGAGATILTTPGHFFDDPLGVARDNDIALARDFGAYFTRRRLNLPGPDDSATRLLYATVAVVPSRLCTEAVDELIRRYAELDVDGFVVWAFKFGDSKRQFLLMRRLALGLERATGNPAVLGGLGQAWKLALASGVTVCFGRQRSRLAWPPEDTKPPKKGEDPKGRGVAIYHPAVLGGFRIGEPGAATRIETFRSHACACGHHPANEPPSGETVEIHNAAMTMNEARDATLEPARAALGHLLSRVDAAAGLRSIRRMGKLAAVWRVTVADFPDLAASAEERAV